MGWNSWDCYGASVTEAEVIAHADFMAEHLKAYGWEYVVVDIQWSEPEAKSTRYNDFYPLCMDDYSRLIPAENRFPSAKDGAGFKNLVTICIKRAEVWYPYHARHSTTSSSSKYADQRNR